jgi:hypothetical protein
MTTADVSLGDKFDVLKRKTEIDAELARLNVSEKTLEEQIALLQPMIEQRRKLAADYNIAEKARYVARQRGCNNSANQYSGFPQHRYYQDGIMRIFSTVDSPESQRARQVKITLPVIEKIKRKLFFFTYTHHESENFKDVFEAYFEEPDSESKVIEAKYKKITVDRFVDELEWIPHLDKIYQECLLRVQYQSHIDEDERQMWDRKSEVHKKESNLQRLQSSFGLKV